MSERSKKGRRPTSGARPFAPGEAPLGVRPGLGGQRRRAGADAGVRLLERREKGSTPPKQAHFLNVIVSCDSFILGNLINLKILSMNFYFN